MTKVQKIWLGVFLAMFIVPEVLWSPVYKMYEATYSPLNNSNYKIVRPNILDGNIVLWSRLLLIELIGMVLFTILLFILRKQFKNKTLFWVIFILASIYSIFVFYMHGFSTIKVSI